MKKSMHFNVEQENLANDLMTTKEQSASEERAQNFVQLIPGHDQTFLPDHSFERRQATEAEKMLMDHQLQALAELMAGIEIRWQLDGAINISAMAGEYIGIHKDIDVSVDDRELDKLDGYLRQRGYGLFTSTAARDGMTAMTRVSGDNFKNRHAKNCEIVSIDKAGKIIRDKKLNFIDVHILGTGLNGEHLMGDGTKFPEKWYQPIETSFRGTQLNLSHPAKVIFFKLSAGRVYDKSDIEKIIELGKITGEDIDDIEKVFSQSLENQSAELLEMLNSIYANFSGNESAEEIKDIIIKNPKVAEGLKLSPGRAILIQKIADEFASQNDRSFKKLQLIVFEMVGIRDQESKYLERTNWLRSLLRDQEALNNAREKISSKS